MTAVQPSASGLGLQAADSSTLAGSAAASFVPNINGFRGVCVLMVFLHHVANSGLPPKADTASVWQTGLYQTFMSLGYGVELFFMISGYVIVLSLRHHASIGAFLKDRVLRIFPVWVPLMLALALVGTLGSWRVFAHTDSLQWLGVVASNLLLLPPLLPLPAAHPASWSLSYEWVFYLTAAAGAALCRRPLQAPKPQRAGVLLLWGLATALLLACFPRSLFFLPGVLVALQPALAQRLARSARLAPLSLAVLLYAWYATGIFPADYGRPLWHVIADGHALGVSIAAGRHPPVCLRGQHRCAWPRPAAPARAAGAGYRQLQLLSASSDGDVRREKVGHCIDACGTR